MTFDELKTELFARGTDYLQEDGAGVTRAENWLNQAIREICNLQAWPFLITTTSPTANEVSIPDLRKVLVVRDTTQEVTLTKATYEELLNDDSADITDTGTPIYYWIESGTIVKSWPVGGTLVVRYIKRVAPISGSQEPPFDEEYHDLIIDRAMIKAYKDSDNFEAAAALRQEYEAGLAAMAEDYLVNTREPSYIQVVDPQDG